MMRSVLLFVVWLSWSSLCHASGDSGGGVCRSHLDCSTLKSGYCSAFTRTCVCLFPHAGANCERSAPSPAPAPASASASHPQSIHTHRFFIGNLVNALNQCENGLLSNKLFCYRDTLSLVTNSVQSIESASRGIADQAQTTRELVNIAEGMINATASYPYNEFKQNQENALKSVEDLKNAISGYQQNLFEVQMQYNKVAINVRYSIGVEKLDSSSSAMLNVLQEQSNQIDKAIANLNVFLKRAYEQMAVFHEAATRISLLQHPSETPQALSVGIKAAGILGLVQTMGMAKSTSIESVSRIAQSALDMATGATLFKDVGFSHLAMADNIETLKGRATEAVNAVSGQAQEFSTATQTMEGAIGKVEESLGIIKTFQDKMGVFLVALTGIRQRLGVFTSSSSADPDIQNAATNLSSDVDILDTYINNVKSDLSSTVTTATNTKEEGKQKLTQAKTSIGSVSQAQNQTLSSIGSVALSMASSLVDQRHHLGSMATQIANGILGSAVSFNTTVDTAFSVMETSKERFGRIATLAQACEPIEPTSIGKIILASIISSQRPECVKQITVQPVQQAVSSISSFLGAVGLSNQVIHPSSAPAHSTSFHALAVDPSPPFPSPPAPPVLDPVPEPLVQDPFELLSNFTSLVFESAQMAKAYAQSSYYCSNLVNTLFQNLLFEIQSVLTSQSENEGIIHATKAYVYMNTSLEVFMDGYNDLQLAMQKIEEASQTLSELQQTFSSNQNDTYVSVLLDSAQKLFLEANQTVTDAQTYLTADVQAVIDTMQNSTSFVSNLDTVKQIVELRQYGLLANTDPEMSSSVSGECNEDDDLPDWAIYVMAGVGAGALLLGMLLMYIVMRFFPPSGFSLIPSK